MEENERIAGANNSQPVNKGWGRRGNLGFPTDGMTENETEENEMRDSTLEIDMKLMNLQSLHQLHSHSLHSEESEHRPRDSLRQFFHSRLFASHIEPDDAELDIRVLNNMEDVKSLGIVEVLDDDEDDYKDMPSLEPVDITPVYTEINTQKNTELHEETIKEPQEETIKEPQEETITELHEDINMDIDTNINLDEEVKDGDKIILLDDIQTIHPTEPIEEVSSVISEDVPTYKKNEAKESEKMGGYRKLSVQTLRELVVSKGIVQDASRLKKGELLNLLVA
jgi:hypothetical protein